jgi:outer membrane protein OmpA-like peptidoglycan-associated protein
MLFCANEIFQIKKNIFMFRSVSILLLAIAFLLSSCSSMSNQGKGTAIGAGVGAALGALIFKNDVAGALIGAAIGGTAGNLIGRKMDRQAEALKQAIPEAEVKRVGEGINITFDSELLFQKGSAKISEEGLNALNKMGKVFADYPDTYILIEGHTSADPALASEANTLANQKLSEERGAEVGNILYKSGLPKDRLVTKGYGGSKPKAPNDSPENMAKNRRVEIGVIANEKMQEEAKAGTLQ